MNIKPLAPGLREFNAIDLVVDHPSPGVDHRLCSMRDLEDNGIVGSVDDSQEDDNGLEEQKIR